MTSLIPEELDPDNGMDWIKNRAPVIALIVGNLLLMVGEYRVYDFVMTQTGEAWKGVFAVLATFLPFIVWEVLAQHNRANGGMILLAFIGMTFSLILGVSIGIADFIIIDGQAVNANWMLGLVAFGLSAHALMFLCYFYLNPDYVAERKRKRAQDREQQRIENAERAQRLLISASERLALEDTISGQYGIDNLQRAIAEITGKKYQSPPRISAPRPSMNAETDVIAEIKQSKK